MNYSDFKIINIPEKSIPGLIRDEIREEKYTQAIDNGEELIDTKVTRTNFYNDEGEILDQDAIDKLRSDEYKNLKMDRHDKLENIALLGKQSGADAATVYNEMKNLRARYKAYKATEDWCKRTLGDNLEDGEVFETPRVKVSHRKSESVEVQDVKAVPDEYLIPQKPKVDKAGLKKVLKQGAVINGVQLVVKDNIQLK